MILIADCGSSKCDWALLDAKGELILNTKTIGFNPNFHTASFISSEINKNEKLQTYGSKITEVYFYGAGCSTAQLNRVVNDALKLSFPNGTSVVGHDLLGAAYATFQGEPGITCILGTGSNACMFDGENLSQAAPSLGYILGDEASGAFFGKQLLQSFLYGNLPETVHAAFQNTFNYTKNDIIKSIYTEPHANVFLAGFMPFIHAQKQHDFIQEMLLQGMKQFLKIHVLAYPEINEMKVNFIGSVAFYFSDILQIALNDLGLQMGIIIQRPIDGLIQYHQSLSSKP